MKLRPACATATLALALITGTARADIVTVHVYSFDFSVNPAGGPVVDAVVNVGDTVRWVFDDAFHSTTAVEGIPEQWDSGIVFAPGVIFDHVFTVPGVWHYYCLPHGGDNGDGTASGMAGTVTVVPAPAGAALLGLAGLFAGRRRR
ncbi:MAG TPA: hypothetical protein VD963_06500 [Phycisphaerales bacterium]|nr:hypothetical protein [Phycisphaerales bacterium]